MHPYNKEYTIGKVRCLMDNDDKRKEMANEAMRDARKFTIESISQQWYNIFKDVLK